MLAQVQPNQRESNSVRVAPRAAPGRLSGIRLLNMIYAVRSDEMMHHVASFRNISKYARSRTADFTAIEEDALNYSPPITSPRSSCSGVPLPSTESAHDAPSYTWDCKRRIEEARGQGTTLMMGLGNDGIISECIGQSAEAFSLRTYHGTRSLFPSLFLSFLPPISYPTHPIVKTGTSLPSPASANFDAGSSTLFGARRASAISTGTL
ncbi:hypothetical protein FB451DRAFT_1559239 [Mycena latifolia]|nr:hypothetical protein FB451DRAFT_1559239 [Mycena latifolia]